MPYSRVTAHRTMLFDTHRNAAYERAIQQAVRPGAVVLDLGAGLGLHGLLAAAAGAARVYLVEPEPVLQVALEVARSNGLGDRTVMLRDRIERARLPEPVDLIISVFTGNLLFSEDLLPSLFFARDRFLKPGGTLIPDRAELWLAPLCAPALHVKYISSWSNPVMGLDYGSARRFAANEILWLAREEFEGTRRLATGSLAAELDLSRTSSGDCEARAHCQVEMAGLCHGLLGWTRIKLMDEWLSTAPDAPAVHWAPALLPIDPPLPLVEGETITLELHRPEKGEWTWSITARAGGRRHSSFLAKAASIADLRRVAPAQQPGLSAEGLQALLVLDLLGQGLSNQAVAERLALAESIGLSEALPKVQALAKWYGGSV